MIKIKLNKGISKLELDPSDGNAGIELTAKLPSAINTIVNDCVLPEKKQEVMQMFLDSMKELGLLNGCDL